MLPPASVHRSADARTAAPGAAPAWPHHVGLAAVVGLAAWFHLRGQAAVPPAYNESWGTLAACLPLGTRERPLLTAGMTLDWLAATWLNVCDFAATSIRWPHPWLSLLAVAIAAFAYPRRRSALERWLCALFLLGHPFALHYGHHGRQYGLLLLAGTALWATRAASGWSWIRVFTGTAAALAGPFAVPWWAALKWTQQHAARAGGTWARLGWWGEVVVMTVATAWQVVLLKVLLTPYVTLLNYTLWERHSRLTLASVMDVFGWRLNAWQALSWWLAAALALWGMRRGGAAMRRAPWLGLALMAAAWPLAAPPLYARYALTLATAWPVWIAAGLGALPPQRPAWRWALGAAVAAGWLATTALYVRGAPDVFWAVEARADLDALQAQIGDGDTVVVWGGMLLEPVALHLLATRRVDVVIWRDADALQQDARRRKLGIVVPWDRLPQIAAQPWVRATSAVSATTLTPGLLQPAWARGARVIGVGALALIYGICDAPCPELVTWQRPGVRVLESPSPLPDPRQGAWFAVAANAAALPAVELLAGSPGAFFNAAMAYRRTITESAK